VSHERLSPLLLLLAVAAAGLALYRPGRTATASPARSCVAADRQFLRAAALGDAELAVVGQSFAAGQGEPAEAIAETRAAALAIDAAAPRDEALKRAQVLLRGMVVEYGRAIRAQWKGGNPGRHMFRSYTLRNAARAVLEGAAPGLERAGCPVRALL
jgi:hypothetical protein